MVPNIPTVDEYIALGRGPHLQRGRHDRIIIFAVISVRRRPFLQLPV